MKSRHSNGLAIALALSLLVWPVVVTAVGPVGGVLNPAGLDGSLWPDSRPLSMLHEGRKRSPSGFLYPYPWKTPIYRDLSDDWRWRGSFSPGTNILTGDTDEARFENYTDWKEGFIAEDFQLSLRNSKRAAYGDLHLSSIGRDDALYRGELGIFGLFRIRGSYDGVPRTYMNDARYLLEGAGGDTLTLPTGLSAGNISAIEARVRGLPETRLEVLRNRSRVELSLTPMQWLKLFARHESTKRKGERALGGLLSPPFFGPGGSLIENVAPVSYRDTIVTTGFEIAINRWLVKLSYQLSMFENRWDSLTWENPFAGTPARGRLALAPDNRAHNIRGELGVNLPWRGRLSGIFSWHTMRQDEKLLPPTINTAGSLSDWNTTAGLSRSHADARVDTFLADTRLRLRPWRPLTLRLRFRYFDRDNKTDYLALNPLNGDVGYFALDDGQPPSVKERIRNIPYEYERQQIFAGASYNLGWKTNLNLDFEREILQRDHRERYKTRENRVRVSLSSRHFPFATLRTSYEFGRRGGSVYDANPNEAFSDSSLFLRVDGSVRRFDVAKRDQHLVSVRINFPVLDVLDLSLAGRYREEGYRGGEHGLRSDSGGDINFELNYQPSGRLNLHAFATYEQRRWQVDFTGLDAATAWELDARETGMGAGAGFRLLILTNLVLETDYDFIVGRERQADPAGEDLPVLRSDRHRLFAKLSYQPFEYWAVHTYYRYDHGTIDDFQQLDDAQQIAGIANRRLFLGHEDLDYTVHVIGAGVSMHF